MSGTEQAFVFDCAGDYLSAIIHRAPGAAARGVLVVVGGPQYRVGSHRQFVLLARTLAAAGLPTMRFDHRGMGDSEGEARDFERIDEDIRAAISAFFERQEGLREVVLWGLCDAASAALFYAHGDPRIAGLVLLNPWIRSERGLARSYLKHYYLTRLVAPELWRKIARGEFRAGESLRSLFAKLRVVLLPAPPAGSNHGPEASRANPASPPSQPLEARMADGLTRFTGRVLFILSGDDLTAGEFRDAVASSRRWRRLLRAPRVTRRDFPGANHTFSRAEWRAQVARWTVDWLEAW